MDSSEFIRDLVASYPQGLRPDVDYLKMIQKEIAKQPCTASIYKEALSNIQGAFRMFPSLQDIQWAFREAFKKVSSGDRKAVEYFDIGNKTYVRHADITEKGELIRKPLPEGATNYQLVLPPELEAKSEAITAEEAYAEGCISEELYQAMKNKNEKHSFKGRFKKIGEFLKDEQKQPELQPVIDIDYEEVDDSMAANPEESNFSKYEDI